MRRECWTGRTRLCDCGLRTHMREEEQIMFAPVHAFSGFSVDDLDAARKFYGETLGLQVTDGEMGVLQLALPTGPQVIVYPRAGVLHNPQFRRRRRGCGGR